MHRRVRAIQERDEAMLSDLIEWRSDPETGVLTAVLYREPTSAGGLIEPTHGFWLIASEEDRPELLGNFFSGANNGIVLL